MLTDNREDWQNRPISYSLNAADRARMLELHEERATERQRAVDAETTTLIVLAQALGLGPR